MNSNLILLLSNKYNIHWYTLMYICIFLCHASVWDASISEKFLLEYIFAISRCQTADFGGCISHSITPYSILLWHMGWKKDRTISVSDYLWTTVLWDYSFSVVYLFIAVLMVLTLIFLSACCSHTSVCYIQFPRKV